MTTSRWVLVLVTLLAGLWATALFAQGPTSNGSRFHVWQTNYIPSGEAVLINDSKMGRCYFYVRYGQSMTNLQPVLC